MEIGLYKMVAKVKSSFQMGVFKTRFTVSPGHTLFSAGPAEKINTSEGIKGSVAMCFSQFFHYFVMKTKIPRKRWSNSTLIFFEQT